MQKSIIKTYKGSVSKSQALFQQDAKLLASQGYVPTSQAYMPGAHSTGAFILATVLILACGIGLIILIYLLMVKPDGMLSVTYELKN